jgi:hypothetical protein
MTDREPGSTQARPPVIPRWVSALSIVVAMVAVTALVWVLFKQTVGPGESVRSVYDAVSQGDCPGAWSALSQELQAARDEAAFCDSLADVSPDVPDGVHVQKVVLLGDEGEATRADVSMQEGDEAVVWSVARNGDAWLITALPESGALAGL